MNKDTLTKVAVGAVGVAVAAALAVLTYTKIVGTNEVPKILTEDERLNVMNAILPGQGSVLTERSRSTITDAVVTQDARPVILSPEERRALMQINEQ